MKEFSPTRVMLDADTLLSAMVNHEVYKLYEEFIDSPYIEPCITKQGMFALCNHFLSNNPINVDRYFSFLQLIESSFVICEADANWLPDLKSLTIGISDPEIAMDVLIAHKSNVRAIVTNRPAQFNQGKNIPIISIDNLKISHWYRQTLIGLRNLLACCSEIEISLSPSFSRKPNKANKKHERARVRKLNLSNDYIYPSKSHVSQWWTIASSRSDCMRRMSRPRSLEGSSHIANTLVSRPSTSFHLETVYEPGRSMRDYWRQRFE